MSLKEKKTVNFGMLTLIFGALTIVFAFISNGSMPLVNSIAAIVCGIITLCKKRGEKVLGILGIILAIIGFVIAIPRMASLLYLFN
ncbi:MAG: hypothetical protein LBS69_01070 [Prevotellaceae bacterium]|jgi:thiamine transporter ThiT|nr:hypothetical protein [Prevotellaceae bacterium]